MIKKFGFTLAEVLITLGIIGVVAAMTIPTLMQKTNDAELKSGYKKFMSVLNQGISMNYALDGVDFSGISEVGSLDDTQGLTFLGFIKNRLNVVGTGSNSGANSVFFSDGTSISDWNISGCSAATGPSSDCSFVIDVNGKKGPNTVTTSASALKDRYTVYGYKRTVSPSTDDAGSVILTNE